MGKPVYCEVHGSTGGKFVCEHILRQVRNGSKLEPWISVYPDDVKTEEDQLALTLTYCEDCGLIPYFPQQDTIVSSVLFDEMEGSGVFLFCCYKCFDNLTKASSNRWHFW